jgi:predicted anti-sigma-YlaC factor YlaD
VDCEVDCERVREALSARIDNESEPLPRAQVDAHLESCRACVSWYLLASRQADEIRRLAGPVRSGLGAVTAPTHSWPTRLSAVTTELGSLWPRWALGLVGVLQLALGIAQATGASFGMLAHHHGASHGVHLLNESTAWSLALGVVMIAAALRPAAASGLAGVLTVFSIGLTGYMIADAAAGLVTPARVLSHLPVLAGTVLAVLVWRADRRHGEPPSTRMGVPAGSAPSLHPIDRLAAGAHTAARTRARHLRPVNETAA